MLKHQWSVSKTWLACIVTLLRLLATFDTVSVKKSFILSTGRFIPVAYGVQKLQISCVVEDDKVGTDFLEEKITEFEDIVSKT